MLTGFVVRNLIDQQGPKAIRLRHLAQLFVEEQKFAEIPKREKWVNFMQNGIFG